jgi:hypothetical protein
MYKFVWFLWPNLLLSFPKFFIPKSVLQRKGNNNWFKLINYSVTAQHKKLTSMYDWFLLLWSVVLYEYGICVTNEIFSDTLRLCRRSAVKHWLPTTAARVCVQAACGVCGGHSGTGAGFFRVLRFPLPIIPLISPSSYSPRTDTIGH